MNFIHFCVTCEAWHTHRDHVFVRGGDNLLVFEDLQSFLRAKHYKIQVKFETEDCQQNFD